MDTSSVWSRKKQVLGCKRYSQLLPVSQEFLRLCLSIGEGMWERFHITGNVDDLDRAIGALRPATDQSYTGVPAHDRCLHNLGVVWSQRYDVTGEAQNRDSAIDAFRRAADMAGDD